MQETLRIDPVFFSRRDSYFTEAISIFHRVMSESMNKQVCLWSNDLAEAARGRKITAFDFQDAVSCLFDLVSLVGEKDCGTVIEVAENFYLFSVSWRFSKLSETETGARQAATERSVTIG